MSEYLTKSEKAAALLSECDEAEDIEKIKRDNLIASFKTLDEFSEEEATWLVPGWMPEGQVTLLASDGGVGKTTLWGSLISAFSSGAPCVLDPAGHQRPPLKVAFLTTEDSIRKRLKRKLRLAGADMKNIIAPDFLDDKGDILRTLKFGTPGMKTFISHFRPAFCVFDPVQGFLPPKLNMGSRNEMRDCMAPFAALGEEYGTTFLIVCHTNKRKGAYGRDRIADSADLWDVSRSVMMAGFTESQGIRYLSNEKNNYAALQQTVLFTIGEDERLALSGTSWKRDKEYMLDTTNSVSAPKLEDCKGFIIDTIIKAGGNMKVKELEDAVKNAGYSFATLKRAKTDLKAEDAVKFYSTGDNKNKTWYIQSLRRDEEFSNIDASEPSPFNDTPSEKQK